MRQMKKVYFNGQTVESLNPLNFLRSYRSSPTEEDILYSKSRVPDFEAWFHNLYNDFLK